jgi:hypothetical protein
MDVPRSACTTWGTPWIPTIPFIISTASTPDSVAWTCAPPLNRRCCCHPASSHEPVTAAAKASATRPTRSPVRERPPQERCLNTEKVATNVADFRAFTPSWPTHLTDETKVIGVRSGTTIAGPAVARYEVTGSSARTRAQSAPTNARSWLGRLRHEASPSRLVHLFVPRGSAHMQVPVLVEQVNTALLAE